MIPALVRVRRCWPRAVLAVGLILGHASGLRAQSNTAGVVYTLKPAVSALVPSPLWTSEAVPRPNGGTGLKVTITGGEWNNYLIVPKGHLVSGRDYTAVIRYEIVQPAPFPNSFHMFARSDKLGIEQDFWRTWNGEPGMQGTATLRFSLKGSKQSDDWMFYVGCRGTGSIIVNDFKIVEGNGLQFVPLQGAKPAKAPQLSAPLPMGAKPFEPAKPAPKTNLTLSTAEFGLQPGEVSLETAAANFQAIQAAIRACRERNAAVLNIPRGVYRFASAQAIAFDDLSDITIEGNGSEFIFQQLREHRPAIIIQRARRVEIRNLVADWDAEIAPISSLCRVVSLAEDRKSCEVTFPEANEKALDLIQKANWLQMLVFDPVMLTRKGPDRPYLAVKAKEKVNANTLRATFERPVPLRVGETYAIRHLYYGFDAFRLVSCQDLLFENVTIHSMPGMGWYSAGDMRNWKLRNCRIVRRPGARNPLTTAADGFHISQSLGNLAIENCEFSGSGDDAINIHDNSYQGVRRENDHTLTLVKFPQWRIPWNVGDRLELFHADYSPLGFTSEIKAISSTNGDTTLTLADVLPADLSPMTIVENRRYGTQNVSITNTRFHDVSGRGILLAAKNASIENCQFQNVVSTAIQFHTEIFGDAWAEGSGASNVTVRGNRFENTSFDGRYENAVVYSGALLPIGITTYPLFHDMLIENNRFINSAGPVVSLTSAKNVTVRNNQMEAPNLPTVATTMAGAFFAQYASQLAYAGNTWSGGTPVNRAGLFVDMETTNRVGY